MREVVPGGGVEVKFPWELSRLYSVITLGRAYWVSGDEVYARGFQELVEDWLAGNPAYCGINWTCAMEAAIRAANLIWGFFFFFSSSSIPLEFWWRLIQVLYLHGQFIWYNLERKFEASSNHYVADLIGLVYLGFFLRQQVWLDFAVQELAREMERQVYADGVDFEASISYHRLKLEFFYHAALLCRLNGVALPERFWRRLERMFEYVAGYLKPSGRAPQVGDNDSGRLHHFCRRKSLEQAYLLSVGALLCRRPEWAFGIEPQEEALWLFGPEEFRRLKEFAGRRQETASCGFECGGSFVLRQGGAYMFVSAGPNGLYGRGGHCHNDKLAFELEVDGEDFFVDPGCYVYTPEPSTRQLFRSTCYHNTLQVDGEEQNRLYLEEVFFAEDDARVKVLKFEVGAWQDVFEGQHSGYERLVSPVVHRRRVVFDKQRIGWQVEDFVEGEGEHRLEWFFQLAPGIRLEVGCSGDEVTVLLEGKRRRLRLTTVRCGEWEVLEGWYSPEYGVRVPNKRLRFFVCCRLPFQRRFNISLVD